MASWLVDTLNRAAEQRGAWTRRRIRARAEDVETLLEAGLVRQVGQVEDLPSLYEITSLGKIAISQAVRS